jgi:hypothetical protein
MAQKETELETSEGLSLLYALGITVDYLPIVEEMRQGTVHQVTRGPSAGNCCRVD